MIVTLALLCLAPAAPPQKPAAAGAQKQEKAPATVWELLVRDYDKNKDGKITKQEFNRSEKSFGRLDTDGDGVITEADTKALGHPHSRPSPPSKGKDEKPIRREPPKDLAPLAGTIAPDFELPLLHAEDKAPVKLSSFRGKKPVALIFGSYT
ncbi:MAG: hypothetical protein ACE5H3_11495 [Planctomycetota bacterium]